SIFVNSVFVFEDGTIKITFNYSGENNTVTLTDLTAAEGGEVFGRCASCSTKNPECESVQDFYLLLFHSSLFTKIAFGIFGK
ncbi:MAG: hypothetical protein IJB19_05220, partial [Clostridia bacterium]|nr:hypothetical protein [Clostridia bacterium]